MRTPKPLHAAAYQNPAGQWQAFAMGGPDKLRRSLAGHLTKEDALAAAQRFINTGEVPPHRGGGRKGPRGPRTPKEPQSPQITHLDPSMFQQKERPILTPERLLVMKMMWKRICDLHPVRGK